jgi:hypothetical protein
MLRHPLLFKEECYEKIHAYFDNGGHIYFLSTTSIRMDGKQRFADSKYTMV